MRVLGRAETKEYTMPKMTVKDAEGNDIEVEVDLAGNPEVQKMVEAAVAESTKGLASNRDEILKEKKELQEKLQALGKQWDGLDPEVVKNLVNRMNTDEETKLIAEGKIDEVVERRVTAMKTDLEARLASATEKLEALEGEKGSLSDKVKNLVIDGMVRQAGAELNLLPTAIEDAIVRAKGRFQLDENDKPVARDEHGTLLIGKDGKSPLSPTEWLEGMKEKAPHWFPTPSGAGAGGGPGSSGGGQFTLTRSQARDPQAYRTAKEAAQKAGQPLQIVDDVQA